MSKVVQFPNQGNNKPAPVKMTREQEYIQMLEQSAQRIFDMADHFGVDVKDVLSDVNYAVIATDVECIKNDLDP